MMYQLAVRLGVALRKESVDRNNDTSTKKKINPAVALRKESVDRNMSAFDVLAVSAVALRKESVDRNTTLRRLKRETLLSLSARRAWIEIHTILGGFQNVAVALRKESVDRNA